MNATRTMSTSTTNTIPSSPFQMEPVAQAQIQAQAGVSSSSSEGTNGKHFASGHSQPQEPTKRIELDVFLSTSSSSTCTIEEHRQEEASFSLANQHNMMTNHHRPPHTVVSGSCASSTATNRSIPSTSGVDAAALDKIVELQTSMFRRALPITTDLQNQHHRRKPAIKSVVHSQTTTSLQRSNKPQFKPLHSSSSLSSIGSTTVSTSTMGGNSKKSKLKRFLAFKQHNKAASSNIGSTVGTGASYSSCCNHSHTSGSNHSKRSVNNKDGESISCTTSSSKMKSVPVLPAFCLDHNGVVSGGSLTSSSKPRSYHCATTSDLITIMIQSKNDSSSGDSTSRPPSKIWQPGEDNGPPPRRPSANHTLRLIQLCKRHPSVNDVIALLKKYPEALKGRNTLGQTPLHVATSVAISAEVILYIFEQDCEAASIQDNCGRYPIHYAARQSNWRSAHAGLFLMMDDDDHDYFYGGGHDDDRPDHGMFDDGTMTFASPPVPRVEEEMDQKQQDVFDYDSDCSTEDDDCEDEEEKKEDTSSEGAAAACPKSSSTTPRGGGFLDASGRSGGGGVVNYNKSKPSKQKYVDHLLDPMYKCMIKTLAKACPKAINHEDHDGINAIEYAVLDENASMDVIKLMQRTCIRELRRLHSSSRLGGGEDDLKKSTTPQETHQPTTILPTSPRSTLTFSARNEVAGRSA